MKKENSIIFSLPILIYVYFYFTMIIKHIPNYSSIINCIFISLLTLIIYSTYKIKKKKVDEEINRRSIKQIIIAIFLYFTVIYILGLFTGYLLTSYSTRILSMFKNSIIPLISILVLEIYRYIYININKESKKNIIIGTIMIILFDILLSYYVLDGTLIDLFIFLTVIVLPIIFKNIVLNYITYKINLEQCLIYVIPIGIYQYFVPVFPDLGNYLTCIINISLPSLVFININRLVNETEEREEEKKKIRIFRTILDTIIIVVFAIFIGLISGYFKYQLIGVDTSAVQPTINRGDAIIVYKGTYYEDYEEGNIIAYRNGKKLIMDVVSKVEEDELGHKKVYIKKEIKDGIINYKLLTKEEIVGLYNNYKISKAAYPTIKFKEFIKGDVNEKR